MEQIKQAKARLEAQMKGIPLASNEKFKDRTPPGRAFRAVGAGMTCTRRVIALALGKRDAKSALVTLPSAERPQKPTGDAASKAGS